MSTILPYAQALAEALRAAAALRAAPTAETGPAYEALHDARAHLAELERLLDPAEVAALVAWLEAVPRTKALSAAVLDLSRSDVEQDVVANAGEQHGAAKRAEARALWALREVVG